MGRKWCQYTFSNYIEYSAFGSCYQVKLSLYGNRTSSRGSSVEKIELVFKVLTLSMHLIGLAEQRRNSVDNFYWKAFNPGAAGFFKARLRKPRFNTKFEFRYKSLKRKFSSILSVYSLMIRCSKNNRENYLRKCFCIKKKKLELKFISGLAVIGPRSTGAFLTALPRFSKNAVLPL